VFIRCSIASMIRGCVVKPLPRRPCGFSAIPSRLSGEAMRQSRKLRKASRQLLAEIYGWFTEGLDTADLQEAQALLAELS
jgi:hypothetical protein